MKEFIYNNWLGNGMKRGQVTLFIIIGLLIVSLILVFFFWVQPTYFGERTGSVGFEGCVEDALAKNIDELALKGGFVNVQFGYNFQGEKIPYLCYTNEFYITCTVQKPFLKQHFEESLSAIIRNEVDTCYSNSVNELKSRGLKVVSGNVEYEILLEPGVARMKIDAPTTVGSSNFARFNVVVNSPIYDMLMLSTSILQYESELGDSNIDTITLLYPEYFVDKLKQGDGTTIYIMESKTYGTKFKFASRSLAWPAGYDIQI